MTPRRRERNMDAKRARILVAARDLFAEIGFAQVTTKAASERADIAAGTLFRYAATKADLLLMVYNERFRDALVAGRSAAAGIEDPSEALLALVMPVLDRSGDHPENAMHYQRELMFGHGPSLHRAAGLGLVQELEDVVAACLIAAVPTPDGRVRDQAAQASRLVFAALHLALAQPSTGRPDVRTAAQALRGHLDLVVRGFLDAARDADTPADTAHPQS